MSDPTMPWQPAASPDVIDGRYRLRDQLGRGAAAEVYRAIDERLARPVAVKLFRGDAAEQLQRHEAEMRTLASLEHPSLVSVYDAGEHEGRPYLVMQLVEGDTLADEMRRGPLDAERVATYGAAMADALGYVHARGVIHRDIKPANVLIGADGRVHLADFGIARLVDSAHVTRTGEVLGTPAYFAPEQVAGEAVGPATDIYALGLVLLECLTGERPFEGTAMEVAMARLSRDPEVPATLPPGWQSLLRSMLVRDAAARPDATAVAAALRTIAIDDQRTVAMTAPAPVATQVMPATTVAPAAYTQRSAPPPARRGRAGVWIAVVLVAVVAAVAIGVALARSHNGGTSTFKPGSPTLTNSQLEKDVQNLEKLVRR